MRRPYVYSADHDAVCTCRLSQRIIEEVHQKLSTYKACQCAVFRHRYKSIYCRCSTISLIPCSLRVCPVIRHGIFVYSGKLLDSHPNLYQERLVPCIDDPWIFKKTTEGLLVSLRNYSSGRDHDREGGGIYVIHCIKRLIYAVLELNYIKRRGARNATV